jgi:hypothetical protein
MTLTKDKQFLVEQMNELNISLSNKIKPKLRQNEDYLLSLEKTIFILKKDNEILIQNDIKQKKLINNYKEENEKLKLAIEKINPLQNSNLNNDKYFKRQYKTNINNNISLNGSLCEEDNNNDHKYLTWINNSSINNLKNQKIKLDSSENNLNFANSSSIKTRYNYDYNYNTVKKNEIKTKIFNDNFENGSSKNDKKSKHKYLYYNSTIKKKDNKDFGENNFCRTKKNLSNSVLNLKIKNLDLNGLENKKENSFIFSHDNQNSEFNLSQNKSLLSSYTEDM